MKRKIKCGIKIYLFVIIIIGLIGFGYSFYLNKTQNDFSLIAKLLISGISFLVLGLAYGNAFHKKGLIVGLIVALIHIILIKAISYLALGTFSYDLFLSIFNISLGAIGGIVGANIKKVF